MTRREMIKIGGVASLAITLPLPLTSFTKYDDMLNKNDFEVIIIGGSYAGLSEGMDLGR